VSAPSCKQHHLLVTRQPAHEAFLQKHSANSINRVTHGGNDTATCAARVSCWMGVNTWHMQLSSAPTIVRCSHSGDIPTAGLYILAMPWSVMLLLRAPNLPMPCRACVLSHASCMLSTVGARGCPARPGTYDDILRACCLPCALPVWLQASLDLVQVHASLLGPELRTVLVHPAPKQHRCARCRSTDYLRSSAFRASNRLTCMAHVVLGV
jgi:hypothetical protein